jgi:hypothetical protein
MLNLILEAFILRIYFQHEKFPLFSFVFLFHDVVVIRDFIIFVLLEFHFDLQHFSKHHKLKGLQSDQ